MCLLGKSCKEKLALDELIYLLRSISTDPLRIGCSNRACLPKASRMPPLTTMPVPGR